MGMSSSQARLLNLTSRLHSIEYKAQRIEAEKLQLANESDRVYNDYLLALEQTKTVVKILNNDGTVGDTLLTAGKVYSYNELGAQYALKTADGKTLIPETLHNNYNNTASLPDFLDLYGLLTDYTQTTINPVYTQTVQDYEADLALWEAEEAAYNTAHDAYLADDANWLVEKSNYDTAYANWVASDPRPKENDTTQDWWEETSYSLGNDFHEAANSGVCWGSAMTGSTGCYRHIIASIVDFHGGSTNSASYTTSLGQSNTLCGSRGGVSTNILLSTGKYRDDVFKEVSDQLDLGIKPKANGETCNVNNSSSEYQKLVSKWNTDGTLKTMKQWAKDLDYVAANSSSYSGEYNSSVFAQTLVDFQSELEGSLLTKNITVFNQKVTEWTNSEPPSIRPRPTWTQTLRPKPVLDTTGIPETVTVQHTTFSDKDLASWYINLWYKMEGEDEVPKIDEKVVYDVATSEYVTLYSVVNKTKSATTYGTNGFSGTTENENYIVIPDDKLNDAEWVHNTLLEGYVLIQSYDKQEHKFNDTSVSVDTKLAEVQDPKDLKKAEAKYEADMRLIDKKDRKYDTELAVFETERNAIKEECETLKTVAKDNTERTFKLFS